MKEGSVIIRPSGNPMDLATWKGMLTSEDVEVVSDEVVSIDTVIELAAGQVAVVVYTTHSVFKYKGTPNDDIAKFSATFEKQADGKWMCAHNHRGTAAWSKWLSWWRRIWPPSAHEGASGGLRPPSVLGKRGPSPQITPRGHDPGARPHQTHLLSLCLTNIQAPARSRRKAVGAGVARGSPPTPCL